MPSYSVSELARRLGARVVGNGERVITAVRPLETAGPEHLSFYHNRRYLEAARASAAGALLVSEEDLFPGRTLLVCPAPYPALAQVLELFYPPVRPPAGVHPTAVVASSARLGEGVSVGPHASIGEHAVVGARAVIGAGCVLGDGVEVGEDTVLHPRVVIEPGCRVGSRCVLHAGVVLGSDGYGFATVAGVHRKVPQVGTVVVEDDVEIGANCTVDRATLGETRIGRGSKLDNLVHVGHNVQVGEHCLLVAQVGISGSTRLGHHVVMAGQSGAVGHVRIGDGAVVTAKTGVTEDTPAGAVVSGFPARPHRQWLKALANLYALEELRRAVRRLEAALPTRRGSTHD